MKHFLATVLFYFITFNGFSQSIVNDSKPKTQLFKITYVFNQVYDEWVENCGEDLAMINHTEQYVEIGMEERIYFNGKFKKIRKTKNLIEGYMIRSYNVTLHKPLNMYIFKTEDNDDKDFFVIFDYSLKKANKIKKEEINNLPIVSYIFESY